MQQTTTRPSPIERARGLAQRVSAPIGKGQEKDYADRLIAEMARDGLLWAVAPQALGGEGLSVADAARINYHVARLSGAAGLIFAMHLSQAMSLVRHCERAPFLQTFTHRMVDSGALVASGTSERGVGGDIFGSICTVEPDGADGLQINKESPNISYLDLAGGILVTAMFHEHGKKPIQVLVAVDREGLELRPGPQARFMGLHGIVNAPYAFKAKFCKEAIFPEPYPVIARMTMTPSVHLFWAAYWSGLARTALDKTRAFLNAEKFPNADVAVLTRCELSRLVDLHYQMNALIRDAIADFEADAGTSTFGMAHTARVKRLKVRCSELVNEICQGALSLVGIRGYAEEGAYSLSEVIRDALSAKVMISNYRLLIHNSQIERYLDDGL